MIEMKDKQLAAQEKKMSQLVIDQTAKEAELKYYEGLSKSSITDTKRSNRWAEEDELAKKRQQQRETLEQ